MVTRDWGLIIDMDIRLSLVIFEIHTKRKVTACKYFFNPIERPAFEIGYIQKTFFPTLHKAFNKCTTGTFGQFTISVGRAYEMQTRMCHLEFGPSNYTHHYHYKLQQYFLSTAW
jgi:hypothetical protein